MLLGAGDIVKTGSELIAELGRTRPAPVRLVK